MAEDAVGRAVYLSFVERKLLIECMETCIKAAIAELIECLHDQARTTADKAADIKEVHQRITLLKNIKGSM